MAEKGTRRELIGTVTGASMDKTVVVRVERRFSHARYGKVIKRANKFVAHDARNECAVGDTVKLRESRPLSRNKRWQLVEVLSRGSAGAAEFET